MAESLEGRVSLNHVGLAVPSIDGFLRTHEILYGKFSQGIKISNATQGVIELFISDGKMTVELLEPNGPRSPLDGFLARNRRGGLIHLALDVSDLRSTLAKVVASGGVLVAPPVPDVAFEGRLIAFVSIDGQLTELIERPK